MNDPTSFQNQDPTSVEGTIEPVSLEMFNKAATDLEAKGMITLRRYTKYLAKKDSKLV